LICAASVGGRTLRVEATGKDGRYLVRVDGHELAVDMLETGGGFASLLIDGRSYEIGLEQTADGYRVVFPDDSLDVELQDVTHDANVAPRRAASGPLRILAPMPGRIVRVLVQPGHEVAAGQSLVVMEAMKMENEIRAPRPGRVREVAVRDGQAVESGAPLVVLE
jgi:biotin carboxyl carrier protein